PASRAECVWYWQSDRTHQSWLRLTVRTCGARQLLAEAALKELRDSRALKLIATVEKAHAKRKPHIPKQASVLCPVDNCTGAHDRGQVSLLERCPCELCHTHHGTNHCASLCVL